MKNLHAKLKNHGKKVIIHLKRHHKKYLFGAFGGFAIFKLAMLGLGAIGVVHNTSNTYASNTDCWTQYGGAPTETRATGVVYGCDGNIPIISIYSGDMGITMKAMNEGAIAIGTGCSATNTGVCGNHYQRGNNYGFVPNFDGDASFPGGETTTTDERVDTTGYGPGNYFNSGIFRKITSSPYDWNSSSNDNLWGGSGDVFTTSSTNFYGFNTQTFQVINETSRQAMCPEGYHVPSVGELNAMLYLWGKNYDAKRGTTNFCSFGLIVLNDVTGLCGTGRGHRMQDDLKIPFVGYRYSHDAGVSKIGDYANLWSSSPHVGNDSARYFYLNPDEANADSRSLRASAFSVRCFKDYYLSSLSNEGGDLDPISESTGLVTFDSDGGTAVDSQVVTSGQTATEPEDPTKTGYSFDYWHLTGVYSEFDFDTPITENLTLYAKRSDDSLINNESPSCDIAYSTTGQTNQDVLAYLTGCSEEITTEETGYTFTGNGTHTFEFEDLAGNSGEATATVDRIDKVAPNCSIEYSTTGVTTGNVVASLTGCNKTIRGADSQHTFTGNGTYTFNFQDLAGNTGTSDATVTWIYNDTGTNGIKSGQQMINLYNQEKAITCNIVYSGDGETGASVMYIKSGMIRQDTRTTYSGTESTMYTLARNGKMYVRGNVYGNGIGFFTSYDLNINEELKGFDDLDQYTTITCSTGVNGLSLFDIPNSIDFFNIDTYYVSTGIYFIVDAKESVKVGEYIDLTITAMKDGRRFKDYSGYILIDIVDQNGNLLNSDLYAVPSFGYYNFVVSDQGTKTFTQGLKVNKTGSYYIKVRAVEEGEGEAPIFVRGDNDPMMSGIYFSIGLDEIIKPGEYTTFTVRVLKDGLFYNNYTGTVLFTLTNKKGGLVNKKSYAIYNSGRYTFETADLGRKTFYGGLKITETGTYILEIRGLDNGGIGSRIVYVGGKHNAADFEYDTLKFNPNYSDEMNEAYQYARYFDITTKNNINYADMYSGLDRIAMAKMLSNYAENVLGISNYNTGRNCKFVDVSTSLDKKYDYGVTRACQLGIMGVNMPNNKFYPEGGVTRAEFATALSRLLYGTPDGVGQYYSTHLVKLYQEKIITNTDPTLQELRGYVMLMLKRSAGK